MQSQLKIMRLLRKVGTHVVSSGNLNFSLCLFKIIFFFGNVSVINLRRLLSEVDFLWGIFSHPAINYFFIVNT